LDGDAAAISTADVDLWVDAILAIQGTLYVRYYVMLIVFKATLI